jgi:hypothetical protein
VGFVLDNVALRQVFSRYFSFQGQLSFHKLLHINLSSCHQQHRVSILTASLNNKHNKKYKQNLGKKLELVKECNNSEVGSRLAVCVKKG